MSKALQLLRNSSVYTDRSTANSYLTAKLATASDGEVILARYTNDTSEIKTLIGVNYTDGTNNYPTIIDIEGINETSESLQESIDAAESSLTVSSNDNTITVTLSTEGTDIAVNIDNSTIVKDDDGVLSVASSALTQYVGENAISISDADSDNNKTVSLTISDSDEILSQDDNGLIANLSVETVTSGLDTNVKEAYNIVGKNSTVLGTIPVYKDSSLYSVSLGTTTDTVDSSTGTVTSGTGDDALVFVYYLADGTYSLVAIDVSDFLRESEFGDGLDVTDGIVSVKIDTSSESYLAVSSSGVKLSGVDSAISTAIGALDVSSVGGSGYYIQSVSETDGVISATAATLVTSLTSTTTSTVAPTSVAVVSYVDSAISDVEDNISELDLSTVGGSGYMVTTIAQTDGQVSATAVSASASNISATASSATSTAVAVTGTTVAEQISSLATSIQTVADTAIEPVAGDGISVTTSGTEATIAIVIDEDDTALEVSSSGLKLSDNAVIDCGEY